MASEIGSLYVQLTADVQPFSAAMSRAERVTQQATRGISKNVGVAESAVSRLRNASSQQIRPYGLIAVSRAFDGATDRVSLLRGALLATSAAFGGFTAAISSNLLLRYADTYTNLNNQIRVVSDSTADLAARFAGVAEVADRSRSSLQSTAILYSRLAKAAPDLDPSAVLRYTETIQKALQLGGATAQEASSAAIQFSQAIASNRLGGEELRAILETPLGGQLAKGLGVSIGRFRELSIQGKLTADVVLGALSNIAGSVDTQFAQSTRTVDQALVEADNALIKYVGSLNEAYGGTRILIDGIDAFSRNLETIGAILGPLTLALAAVFGGKFFAGLGGRLTSPVKQFREEYTRAKVEIQETNVALREQKDVLRKTIADTSKQAIGIKLADPINFAPKENLKGLEQLRARLTKLDEEYLAVQSKVADAVQKVAAVEVRETKALAKLKEQQIGDEKALATANQATLAAVNRRLAAEKELAAAQANSGDVVKNTVRIAQLQEEIAQATRTQATEAARAATISTSASKAEAAALVNIARLEEQRQKNARSQIDAVQALTAAEQRLIAAQAAGDDTAKKRREIDAATKQVAESTQRLYTLQARGVELNDKQIEQEARLAQARDTTALAESAQKQIALVERRIEAEKNLAAAQALAADDPNKLKAVADARAAVTAAIQEQTAEETRAAKINETMTTRGIRIDEMAAEARSKADKERVASLKQRNVLEAEATRLMGERQKVEAELRAAAGAARDKGIPIQTQELGALNRTLSEAKSRFGEAQAAAFNMGGALRQSVTPAVAGLRSVGLSFYSFLGGGWGLLFAGATAALGIFGAQAAAEAARVATLNEEINRLLAQAGKLEGAEGERARAATDATGFESAKTSLENLQAELDKSQKQLDLFRQLLATPIPGQPGVDDATLERLDGLITRIRTSQIDFATFKEEFDGLASGAPKLDAFADRFKTLAERIFNLNASLPLATRQFQELSDARSFGEIGDPEKNLAKIYKDVADSTAVWVRLRTEALAKTELQLRLEQETNRVLKEREKIENPEDATSSQREAAAALATQVILIDQARVGYQKTAAFLSENAGSTRDWADALGLVARSVAAVADPYQLITERSEEQIRAADSYAAANVRATQELLRQAGLGEVQLRVEQAIAAEREKQVSQGVRLTDAQKEAARGAAIASIYIGEFAAQAETAKNTLSAIPKLFGALKAGTDIVGITGDNTEELKRRQAVLDEILSSEVASNKEAAKRSLLSETQLRVEEEIARLRAEQVSAGIMTQTEAELRSRAQINTIVAQVAETVGIIRREAELTNIPLLGSLAPLAQILGLTNQIKESELSRNVAIGLATQAYQNQTAEIARRGALTEQQRQLEDELNAAAQAVYNTTFNGLLPAQREIVEQMVRERIEAEKIAAIRAKTLATQKEITKYDVGGGKTVTVTRPGGGEDNGPVLQKVIENGVTVYRVISSQTPILTGIRDGSTQANGYLTTLASNLPPGASAIGSSVASGVSPFFDSLIGAVNGIGGGGGGGFGFETPKETAKRISEQINPFASVAGTPVLPPTLPQDALRGGAYGSGAQNPNRAFMRNAAADMDRGGGFDSGRAAPVQQFNVTMLTPPPPQSQDLARAAVRADLQMAVAQALRGG